MRYREDSPEDLDRARRLVRAWRGVHPDGTAAEMAAELAPEFRPGYEPVLRGVLAALELHGAKVTTGITIITGEEDR